LTSRNGPFGLIRELLKYARYIKYYYRDTGILEMVLAGHVVINAQIIEGMKKSGYILESVSNSVALEFVDRSHDFPSGVKDEDDVPEFVSTTIRFKDTLENGRKSDMKILTKDKQQDRYDEEWWKQIV
jgi:hypothetical protein